MFGKVKAFLVDKAFGLAYMRYDRDGTGTLNPNQLTSLVNDVFQLLRIQRQASFIEVGIIMKMLDIDGDSQLTKDQAYNAVKGTLAKFGGLGGVLQFFGKTGSAMTIKASTTQKTIQNSNYVPPQDIDESMLKSLPPVGQNLSKQDINKKNQGQQNNQSSGSQNQSWGGQNQAWGSQGGQNQAWGNQGGHNQGWGGQNQSWGNQQQQQQNQAWGNWKSDN